ncbi:MAG: hypothetical protein IID42_12255 [Planctomycetes bacterium]|nr:hypothetical protein [Planctomycetota bacterium]
MQGSSAGGHTTLTAAQGFTNAGTLRLESINGGFTSSLTVTTGALTNTGTITVGQGNGGARSMTAELVNSGTVNVGTSLTLGRSGAGRCRSCELRQPTLHGKYDDGQYGRRAGRFISAAAKVVPPSRIQRHVLDVQRHRVLGTTGV